ncbi:DNA helicase [Arthrobacter phage BenitoAntonio]|nr:DNA helicase [Arthrobacter phage BenitoAntonio]
MNIDLDEEQLKALGRIRNGSIVRGDVGSGKSRVGLAYYFKSVCGGTFKCNGEGETTPFTTPKDIFIITTAKKRDDLEWEKEGCDFGIGPRREVSYGNVELKVDSWNNLLNYTHVKNAFFIFDEQRLVGSGAWVKAFLKIAAQNEWIMLTATPGDNWMDYIPVLIANGYYKNRTEFCERHVKWKTFVKFPQVDRYLDEDRLEQIRSEILVQMHVKRHTIRHVVDHIVTYDKEKLDRVMNARWHVYKERPLKNAAELFLVMRQVVNEDASRADALLNLHKTHPRMIVFYNFTFELEILREIARSNAIPYAEWNGKKHEDLPTGSSWLYLVQYTAGAEGWNCTTTDTTVFYSLNYSYKINEQSKGRIDRRNTPYVDLYYYIFMSNSPIDKAIARSLRGKKNFNEKAMLKYFGAFGDDRMATPEEIDRFARKYDTLPEAA